MLMDKCRMNNYQGYRPYYPPPCPAKAVENRTSAPCRPARECDLSVVDSLPLAMGYIPCQKFCTTFELCKALQVGTIFPELCKPFIGKQVMNR